MDSVFNTIQNSGMPIVIFGTKAMAQMVRKTLETKKCNLAYWCDNDPKMQNTILKGYPVIAPKKLHKYCSDAVIIVCSFHAGNMAQMQKQVKALGFTQIIDGRILFAEYMMHICDRGLGENTFDQVVLQNENKNIFPSTGVLITERCSLNCKNCTSLIPYFHQPINYNVENIVRSVERLLNAYKALDELTLVGGEPLLHPDLLHICRRISNFNIKKISIITNGTIVPAPEVMHEINRLGIYFLISDYGEISHKEKFIAACERYDVIYEVLGQDITWFRIVPPAKQHRDKEENREIYRKCIWKHCNTIQDGILTACPYIGSVKKLKPECVSLEDYIDLLDNNVSNEEIVAFVDRMYREQESMPLCDYCSVNKAIKMPRAEQAKGKLAL